MTNGHSRHSLREFVFAGKLTDQIARVSMVNQTTCIAPGTTASLSFLTSSTKEHSMNSIIYLVGAVVIIIAVLSFFGMR
jgi:hypothetical protein